MEQIRLDIIPKGIMPVCHASQYDKGRKIRFNLMDGLQGYTLTDEQIDINVRKPDGNVVTASVDVTEGATYVDIVTTEQMTAVAGENICELKIMKGEVEIGTLNFKMKVEKDVLEGGIESESFIYNLKEQIYEAVAGQYEGNVIFDDVPTADHGTPYTVTSEGIKQAIEDATPDNLSDLNDVNISSPSSNQALVWDADNNEWTNGEVSTVGSIDDLNDVDTSGKASGDSLRYDGAEWIAQPTTIALTQAEYNAIVDFTPYANTHIVITDAPNLNPTASDIEYSGGVTVYDKINNLTATNITVDATPLPFSAPNVQSALGTMTSFLREDVSTQIANAYSGLSDVTAELFRVGIIGILQVRLKCTTAVSSGDVTLTTNIKSNSSYTFRSSVSSRISKGGFMEYSNKTFRIRCDVSSEYLVGMIVFPIGF